MNNFTSLPAGKTIAIGRKASCDVVIDSILISSTHCKVKFISHTASPIATVSDHSKNGTWIMRGTARDPSEVNGSISKARIRTSPKIEKLPNGVPRDLHAEDVIMLLAPGHKQNPQYRYKLCLDKSGNCFLRRLCPPSASSDGVGAIAGAKRSAEEKIEGSDSVKKARSDGEVCTNKKSTRVRPAEEAIEGSDSVKKARSDGEVFKEGTKLNKKAARMASDSIIHIESSSEKEEDGECEDRERCPSCRKLFPVSVLPIHCPACQGAGIVRTKATLGTAHKVDRPSVSISMEECPNCQKILPITELPYHVETCLGNSTEGDDASDCYGECPYCLAILSVSDLIEHSGKCREGKLPKIAKVRSISATANEVVEVGGPTWPLGGAENHSEAVVDVVNDDVPCTSGVGVQELEQCAFCLNDFPLCDLPAHYSKCRSKAKKCDAEEHCQHCLKIFPLDELINHAMNCSEEVRTKGSVVGGDEGELVERCIHCFKDFPLSTIVEHSYRCTGNALGAGARERFKNFIPSVHDIDPRALSILTARQRKAVDYVREKSRRDSAAVYLSLFKRVTRLGFSENDLKETFHWICRDAPIIIHLNLDKCLHFLVKDTHYRNLFETNTGGGGDCKNSRRIWENRIFNKIYNGHVSAFDRVKYGVLNIVGDPRGVQCCTSYGDSFLQLKKVRLRTTFASADTAGSNVKLSCCEHYGNVLYEYNDMELQAVLDVATRRKIFLRSDVISHYKEVQIHGPVCLSENVDCIVVNERHGADPNMRGMLDTFVERNKCNLIWMEPANSIDYPSRR